MRQGNYTFAQAEACFYEAMRVNKGSSSEWSADKEGNALIDIEKTPGNYELITHHVVLDPSHFYERGRGSGIAELHKELTGRTARMNGKDEQKSKAVGCIITLPRDYLEIDYGLTEEEYVAVARHVENATKDATRDYISAMSKIQNYAFNDAEKEKIKTFFEAALTAWMKVADVRMENILYAVVHMDESFPHLHIMCLPTIVDPVTGKITCSTSKYNNRVTHYYDKLHQNVIDEMRNLGIDASGLLNGVTKEKGFSPSEFNREQRAEGVRRSIENKILKERCEQLERKNADAEMELLKTEGKRTVAERELEETRKSNIANTALSKKELKAHHKELQRVQKSEGRPQITQYEYDKLVRLARTAEEFEAERKVFEAQKCNFNREVKKAAEAMFPMELQKARKEKEYCDEWLPHARAIEEQWMIICQKEEQIAEREAELENKEQQREREINEQAQIKAQEIYKCHKETLIQRIWEKLFGVFTKVVEIIGEHLSVKLRDKIIDMLNDIRTDIVNVFEEQEIEIKERK